jgi:diguanylate cyclase (GGDEF)-like protein
MISNDKFNKILEAGKKIFIKEQLERIDFAIFSLLRYSLDKNKDDENELIRFFHSLKGAGASFKLYEISNLGKYYEEYLEKNLEHNDTYIVEIIKGIAKVKNQFDILNGTKESNNETTENSFNTEDFLLKYITKSMLPTILVIDDDISILNQEKTLLEELNYKIITSKNPDEYLNLIEKNRIDLLLLDLKLKNTTGLDFLKKLKNSNLSIPTILITSDTDDEIKLKAYEFGADDYINKPFDFKEFQIRVKRVVNNVIKSKNLVNIDDLTKAYSKNLLNTNIKIAQYRLKKLNEPSSICLLDINSFNHINNLFGYENGDLVLEKFVTEFNSFFEENEQIYRLDEDEFLVLMPNKEKSKAYELMEKIRSKFSKKEFFTNGIQSINIKFSGGITSIENSTSVPLDIINKARLELKIAKSTNLSTIYPKNTGDDLENSQKSVLIIDDMNSIIFLLKKHLEEFGFKVDFASDGEKGLEKALKTQPDLILLDIILPKIGGIDILKKIRQNRKLNSTKIIIISSRNNSSIINNYYELGANYYLGKPISLHKLQKIISELFY